MVSFLNHFGFGEIRVGFYRSFVLVVQSLMQRWAPDGRPPVARRWPGHFLFGGLVLIKA